MKTDITKLDYIEKRNLKYSDSYDDSSREYFAKFSLESGNITDAIDAYSALGNVTELEKILKRMVSEGDLFHYKYINKLLKREINPEDLVLIIENSKNKGLIRYSSEAQQLLESIDQAKNDKDAV